MSDTLDEAVDVLINLADRQFKRIEALETALRMIIMRGDERAEEIARAALAPEQDK
jgi:hypothetical protein